MCVIPSEGVILSENFLRGGRLHDFGLRGGRLQEFRLEVPENGTEGAVLENFADFSENLFLKTK